MGELAAVGGGIVPTGASADIRRQAIGEVDAKLSANGKVSIVIMGRDIGRGRCRWLKSLKPVTRGTVRPVIIVERAYDNVEAFKITQNLEFVGDILSVLASPGQIGRAHV